MDNLTEKLNQLLQDPASLDQIVQMAASLGLPMDSAPQPEQMALAMHRVQALEEKQSALINALLPYLRPGRRARLERAMEIARLTQMAGCALQTGGKEAAHV